MTERSRSLTRRAEKADLEHVSDDQPGIRRQRRGRGFSYRYDSGQAVRDRRQLDRIQALAIPPAWTDVWICRDRRGHLQATGRDDRDRKQFLYHADWQRASTSAKFDRLFEFGQVLPRIRRRASKHLRQHHLTRTKILAVIVRLLDLTGMRVGNEEYVADNGSRGITTLQRRHVRLTGARAEFRFPGKSRQRQVVSVANRTVVRTLHALMETEQTSLFAYESDGQWKSVDAEDVNDYLREISTLEITAKDFRTWLASAQVGQLLYEQRDEDEQRVRKRIVVATVKSVAKRLGNTPAVCRNSYLDPRLLEAFEGGKFPSLFKGFQCRKRKWLRDADQILLHGLAKV